MRTQLFDRPLIILAAPRSGSTLLFETLARAPQLWTVGGESHHIIEGLPQLAPVTGAVESNRLDADHADERTIRLLRQRFALALRDRRGRALVDSDASSVRLLEKTPKNALRQPFLEQVFPAARYVWLTREPRANIASMINAWQSGRWVTYRRLPGWQGRWSLLLPPDWRDYLGQSLESVCTYQWCAANRTIRDDLSRIEPTRWLQLDYTQLVDDPLAVCRRIATFADLAIDPAWQRYLEQPLPHSRYTLTPPRQDKWRQHEIALYRTRDQWQPLWHEIRPATADGAVASPAENPAKGIQG